MGRTLYAYADKLWEVSQRFVPTGEARQFTIQPGEYLFMCYGGKGGPYGTYDTENIRELWNYGAAAYGVFTTDREETLYAVVGGNGETWQSGTVPGEGGFNGGGRGGYSSNGSNACGAGGGGASDIRLSLDPTLIDQPQRNDIPNEYVELYCIDKSWGTDGCFNTGYNLNSHSKVVVDMWIQGYSVISNILSSYWAIVLGSRSDDNSTDEFFVAAKYNGALRAGVFGPQHASTYTNKPYGQLPHNRNFTMTIEPNRVSWVDQYGETDAIENIPPKTDSLYPLYLFALNHKGTPDYNGSIHMRVYECKIYEDDVLLHHFFPVKRVSDNALGFYDVVTQEFRGVIGTLFPVEKESRSTTLLSRILVAAGGGGSAKHNYQSQWRFNFGGGKIGTPLHSMFNSTLSLVPPTQTDGAAFGKGMDGVRKSGWYAYGVEGGGGGGGGWFGGYSPPYDGEYSGTPGSGGSSYALTSDSWKPYGYVPTSHYYLTHTALVPCQSSEGLILVCTPVKTLYPEDKIIIPFQGKETKIKLFPGTYNVKCWGGEGGSPNASDLTRSHGGYSEGRLEFGLTHDIYAVVGGTGLWYDTWTYDQLAGKEYNEYASFNGGGLGQKLEPSNWSQSFTGGGATDLRLTMDQTPAHPTIPDPETRDDIPSGYTQLKAIVSTSYFDPGYIRKANSGFFVDMSTRDNLSGYEVLFGNGNDGSSRNYYFYTNPPSRNYVAHWQVTITEANGTKKMPSQTRVKVTVTPTTITWSSDTDSETLTVPEGSVQDGNMSMFFGSGRNGYGTEGGVIAGTWYAIKINEDGTIIHDFVPCKNNSNNQIGLYDVTTDTFYQWGDSYIPLSDITYPSKSLMSRFIVAGGGGGYGYPSGGVPGKGGGTTGGTADNGYGENNGPGTQTSSSHSLSHPEIDGGFGYGGNGILVNGGRGGGGGAGWFGGSGTYPDYSSDNDKGGAGGSGYVLTESSYKPEYYIPDSEFYMTNASTVLGGNTLPPNITKIEIDVIEAFCNKLVLYDNEGYKAYDEDLETWTVFSPTITPELIDEYGRFDIPNVNGTLDEFEVIMDDPDDALTGIEVEMIPLPQSIVFLVPRRYTIGRTVIDAVYDTSIYDFSTNVEMYDDQYNAYTVTVDKLQDVDEALKLYSIMLFSK